MDRKRKGVVDCHDFKVLYTSLGLFCREVEYQRLLDLIGLHPGGNLKYAEFVDIIEHNGKHKQRTQTATVQEQLHELLAREARYKWADMSKVLCQFDSDGHSRIHKKSLTELLYTYALPMRSDEFDQLWSTSSDLIRPTFETKASDITGHLHQIQEVLSGHLYDVTKQLMDLDPSHSATVSKEQFRQLCDRHSLRLTNDQFECVWSQMPVKEQKELQYREFLKRFGVLGRKPRTEAGGPTDKVPLSAPEPRGAASATTSICPSATLHRRKSLQSQREEQEKIGLLQEEVTRLGKLLKEKDKIFEQKDELLKKKDNKLGNKKEKARIHKQTLRQLTDTQTILDVNELKCKALEEELEEKDKHHRGKPGRILKELTGIEEKFRQYLLQADESYSTELSELGDRFEKKLVKREMTVEEQLFEKYKSHRKELSEQEERFKKKVAEREQTLKQQLLVKDESHRKELSDLEKRFEKLAEREETLKQQLLEKDESYRKELSEQGERFEKKLAERVDTLKQQLLEKEERYRKELIDRREMSDLCASWETKAQLLEKEKMSLEEVILMKERNWTSEEAQRNEEPQGLRQENTRLQELQEQHMRKKKKKCFLLRIFQCKK